MEMESFVWSLFLVAPQHTCCGADTRNIPKVSVPLSLLLGKSVVWSVLFLIILLLAKFTEYYQESCTNYILSNLSVKTTVFCYFLISHKFYRFKLVVDINIII